MYKTHTLYSRELINDRAVNASIGVLFFIFATALGAYARIPVKGSPVPITLQTFFVLLSGALLGKRLGALSQFGYLVIGIAGFPVFQGYSSGLAALSGPTGGYLAGFVCASYFLGSMVRGEGISFHRAAILFAAGSLIIYTFGIGWLVYAYRLNVIDAVSVGVLPFIPGDIVKIFCAAIIYQKVSKRASAIFPS